MTLVREPGSEIIAQFSVPSKGTWLNTAINNIPTDAVYDSLNVFMREGKLRNRPGLLQFAYNSFPSATPDIDRTIIGGSFVVTPVDKRVFAVAPSFLHMYDDVTDTFVILNTPFSVYANSITDVVDLASIETSGTYVVLFANENYALKVWVMGGVATAIVTGTNIPFAKSICISASRVIALVAPHTIVWSRILDYTNFDPLAIVKRAQTLDVGICVRSLSALSFVLYKEHSIHVARAQAGLDEGSAFNFSEPILVEGPAGIYAVTDVDGTHIYMTRSGRIGAFDGTGYPRWIADAIWFYLQEHINQAYSYLIRATYDYRLNIVIFFYPKTGETDLKGMVILNLPFPGHPDEIGTGPHCFLGECQIPITHSQNKRFDDEIDNSMVFERGVLKQVLQTYTLDEDTHMDGIVPFTCSFQTGLQSAPDARHIQTTCESFIERGVDYGTVDIIPVTSDTLETPGGTVHTADAQTIDLETTPVNEYIGFNKKTRFFGFKYVWSSLSTVRYAGTVVYDSVFRRR